MHLSTSPGMAMLHISSKDAVNKNIRLRIYTKFLYFFTKLYIYFFSTQKYVRQVQNLPIFSLISTLYAIYSLTLCPQKPYAVEAPSNRIHEHIYKSGKSTK